MKQLGWMDRFARRDAIKQSSQWIARLQADDVSEAEREQFEKWRTAHPLHARAYDELHTTLMLLTEYRNTLRWVFARDC